MLSCIQRNEQLTISEPTLQNGFFSFESDSKIHFLVNREESTFLVSCGLEIDLEMRVIKAYHDIEENVLILLSNDKIAIYSVELSVILNEHSIQLNQEINSGQVYLNKFSESEYFTLIKTGTASVKHFYFDFFEFIGKEEQFNNDIDSIDFAEEEILIGQGKKTCHFDFYLNSTKVVENKKKEVFIGMVGKNTLYLSGGYLVIESKDSAKETYCYSCRNFKTKNRKDLTVHHKEMSLLLFQIHDLFYMFTDKDGDVCLTSFLEPKRQQFIGKTESWIAFRYGHKVSYHTLSITDDLDIEDKLRQFSISASRGKELDLPFKSFFKLNTYKKQSKHEISSSVAKKNFDSLLKSKNVCNKKKGQAKLKSKSFPFEKSDVASRNKGRI